MMCKKKKKADLNINVAFVVHLFLLFQVNIFFFFITVWKLAQKFSSVNPDLDDLHKIE